MSKDFDIHLNSNTRDEMSALTEQGIESVAGRVRYIEAEIHAANYRLEKIAEEETFWTERRDMLLNIKENLEQSV